MSIDCSLLNPAQRLAVETTEGPVLVLSGAGTGKTRVLTARAAHILEAGLAQPWQILALTFTNKAANEMKRKLGGLLWNSRFALGDLWCGTFHSVCLRILRGNAERAGLGRNFMVFGEDDQKAVLKNVIANLGLDAKEYNPSDWVEKISNMKDKGLDAARTESFSSSKVIYEAYNAELARLNGVDFGDLILKVLELFQSSPDVLEKYRRQFLYILVDEFQDTNAAQYQFLRMLAQKRQGGSNICCVGDDDQSIYSWRGAEIKNILEFEKNFPGAKIIRLETNYRSTAAILGAANSLIRRNRGRLGKDLRPADCAPAGEKVFVLTLPTDRDEARAIANAIELGVRREELGVRLCRAKRDEPLMGLLRPLDSQSHTAPTPNSSLLTPPSPYSSFAVLIRAGSLSRVLEEEFASRGIPYKLIGAMKFYDRMEIRDAVAYARLLAHPFDDLSFVRVIGKPRRGFGDSAIAGLRGLGGSLMAALRAAPLRGKQRSAADGFLRAFDFDWDAAAPRDAVAKLLEDSGYLGMWRESKDAVASERLANISELLDNVISKYDSLQEFLEHASLMMTEDDQPADGDAVGIMTIHAAKGLEFDTVFLPAWEEGIFPNEMALGDGSLEEERRLAYVAITRARKRAVITNAMSRMVFGKRECNPPSRFIGEIGEDFVDNRNGWMFGAGEARESRPGRDRGPGSPSIKPSMVGKLVSHDELGGGVVIEESGEILTIAFKNKGIKKVAKQFITER